MRRTLIIIAIVILLIGIGVAAYFYFFSGPAGIVVTPTGNTSLPTAGNASTTTSGGTGTKPTIATPSAPTVISARLVKIDVGPVVLGEAVVDISVASSSPVLSGAEGSKVTVNYIERQSGNVFLYDVNAGTITRINNQTIPGIQSAVWLPNAATAFVRYLSGADFSTVNTYALPANGGEQGFFLPQNLADIAISSTSVLTLASGVNGSVASLGHPGDTKAMELFSTPLSKLRASFAGNQYLAFTKPSAGLAGAAYLVDVKGNFSRIAGPLNGLVALASPLGKWVLVSYARQNTMQMELVNAATSEIVPLPVVTIADKCTWTADDAAIYCGIPVDPPHNYSYPDDWYQGAVHFSDRIWKIDVAGRYAQLVLDFPKETNGMLDAEALAIDPNNTELVFINKNDSSLWGYQL